MKITDGNFANTMTKGQKTAGLIYLPLHVFVLPLLLGMAGYYLPGGLSLSAANIIYYAVGFFYCLGFMWRYLRLSYDIFLDNAGKSLIAISTGYLLSLLLSFLVSSLMLWLFGDEAANPNNELVLEMADMNPQGILGLVVFLAPVVEEVLFRGVIFGALRNKSRFLAFAVSILAFGIYHVWQLALAEMDWQVLLFALEYLPLGFAFAWVYEKSGSIWAPIFLHMLNNALALFLLS